MYEKTSSIEFKKYGIVYNKRKNKIDKKFITKKVTTDNKVISILYKCCDKVCIEIEDGMACILISQFIDRDFQLFGVHRNIELKGNMYFNIIPITPNVTFSLILKKDYNINIEFLNKPYIYNRILPTINILEIMAYYYTIKSPNYVFDGEKHNIYELTFVDNGTLSTNVDGTEYVLNAYDLIIYNKNQFHTQWVNGDKSCSYLTILFDMNLQDSNLLCNRVFNCKKTVYKLIRKFVKNSSNNIIFTKDLMLTNFQEIIIKLLQYDYSENEKLPNEIYDHFQNEILNDIIKYIEDTIYEPITIEDICTKFAISRSSLQILFKDNLSITPKKYITNLKLDKSKLLIKENKYTISEIAFMLGFSSIHYFSRAFTKHFKISPREYSQTIFN